MEPPQHEPNRRSSLREPDTLCVHEAFDHQVALTPTAPAVVDGLHEMTYAELQRRADQLSLRLRSVGLIPGSAVALLADRSVDAVVALLAVLKAGSAYVPLNPRDPDERLASILHEAGAGLVLVQRHLRERIRATCAVIEVNSDATSSVCERVSIMAKNAVSQKDLAAIVYTSGSAGAPKGVEISHLSIMARVRHGYPHRRGDLQKAPLNVVAHFSDLLLPLVSGGPVIFLPDSCLRSGRGLSELVRRYGTTRMVFVPSQLSALMEAGAEVLAALGQLDSVIVSGEPLGAYLVREFKNRLPQVALLNAYGASEVSGLACMGEVDSPENISVGHAIAGCTVHVLDDELNPVQDGADGEVYIGGLQVARGYRRNPSLTAERFLTIPLRCDDTPLFRTGDRARRLQDGRLVIVGRTDFEVKVHGLRVNLNEVETALEALPGVHRAIALLSDKDGPQRLVGFVARTASFDSMDTTVLREALMKRVPSQMVPSKLCDVDDWPLLPNGKIDRLALSTTSDERWPTSPSTNTYVAPRTPTERRLAKVWQQVLGVERVGVNDDFFALGGDSLDATRLMAQAASDGLLITPEQLEASHSLAELAGQIENSSSRENTTVVSCVAPASASSDPADTCLPLP